MRLASARGAICAVWTAAFVGCAQNDKPLESAPYPPPESSATAGASAPKAPPTGGVVAGPSGGGEGRRTFKGMEGEDEEAPPPPPEPLPSTTTPGPAGAAVIEMLPGDGPANYRPEAKPTSGTVADNRARDPFGDDLNGDVGGAALGKNGLTGSGAAVIDLAQPITIEGKLDADGTVALDPSVAMAGEVTVARGAKDKLKAEEDVRPSFARNDPRLPPTDPNGDHERFVPPPKVLPRMFYFENTYLGGSAAYAERLRKLEQALSEGERHYKMAKAEEQPFDPPQTDGLGVTASLDVTHSERPQRVFLQVGLQGSDRYGWRRPPLDLALVLDPSALAAGPDFAERFVIELMRKLGTGDRLAIVIAGGEPTTFLELSRTASAQQSLARRIDTLGDFSKTTGGLGAAMTRAGAILHAASDDEAIVPGSQTILVLTGSAASNDVADAAARAHELTIQGAVTSVFTLDSADSGWWQVANQGYGNFHRIDTTTFGLALDEELASLARVVARLVRVNIRLGKDTSAIRVLGTRVLDEAEARAVKAREVATDINLSKSLGIASDRGEDDDGIQTVIPYFYGDDSHVILVELWVEKPGLVADITVRYKDMVNLDNATARTSVKLGARPQVPTREQTLIAQNVRGFELAESLQKASNAVRRGDLRDATQNLEAAKAMATTTNALDVQAVEGLKAMVDRGSWQYNASERANLGESLLISGQRRVGDTDQQ